MNGIIFIKIYQSNYKEDKEMRGKKVLAVMLCAAMVSSNMGMISMAGVNDTGELLVAMSQKEESSETDQKLNHLKSMGRVASPSEPEKPASPSEPEKPTSPPEPEKPTTPSEPDEPATPSEATYYVSTEEQLREAVKQDGEIVLESEISLTEPLAISKNVEISIEGKKITFAGKNTENEWQDMIGIYDGANVTLHNITIDATGMDYDKKYNDSDNWRDYYAVWVASNAKITLTEGAEIIAADNEDTLINPNKRGMWVAGDCLMEDGNVSGFVEVN